MWPDDQKGMLLGNWEPLILSHHPAKFRGHMIWSQIILCVAAPQPKSPVCRGWCLNISCGSGDITFLFCHETSSENVIKCHITTLWEKALYPKPPLCQIWQYRPNRRGDVIFSLYHLKSREHMIKATCNLVSENSSTYVTNALTLMLVGLRKWKYNLFILWYDITWIDS